MVSRPVAAALHQLRRFRPESTGPLDRLDAATDVLGEALDRLRLTSGPEFAVPSVDVVLDLADHVHRSRVLGDVFDETARRFERSQDARTVTVPSVFGRYPATFVGPVPRRPATAHGRAAAADARWLEDRLAQAAGRPASVLARQIGAELRRKLGLLDVRPYVVDVSEHRIRLAGEVRVAPGLAVGGSGEQVWTIVELSDGTATASLGLHRRVEAGALGGVRLEVGADGQTVGFDQRTKVAVGGGLVQGWAQTFGSRREAEEAMHHGRFEGFEVLLLDAVGSVLPGASWLAGHLGGDVRREATRTARSVEVAATAGTHLSVAAGSSLGPSLTASGSVTLTEQRDREAATTTDVLAVDGRIPAGLAGALGLAVPASTASVAVTRDTAGGAARALTVNVTFEAVPGLRPTLGASQAAGTSTGPNRSTVAAPADEPCHRYDVTVEVDLTDPRNEAVAAGLSVDGPAVSRLDEDVRAVTRVPGLGDDVLARSRITVLEQAPEGPRGVSVEGLPVEGAVITRGWRTVQAWESFEGRLQPV